MNLFGFFKFTSENAFAKDLARQLASELPADLLAKSGKLLSVNKITRHLEQIYQPATAYGKTKKVGFIRQAVIANTFKWELKNKGYSDEFVDLATEGLVVRLAKAKNNNGDSGATQ